MKVFIYSEMQKMIEKSGVGRALYHQQQAARENDIELADRLEDADVVHINTVFPRSVMAAQKAARLGIPVIYHAHSTREDFKNSYIGSNLFAGLFGKWITYCYKHGTMIVTPSEYSKSLLKSYGIDQPIEVISNGVDLSYYDRKKVDFMTFRNKYGYSAQDKIIMCAGLTIDRKGVTDFVELARHMPQYKFIWFGETNLNTVPPRIRKAVRTKLPNLRFAGYAQPEELREAYGSCDLFLFPSKEETEGIVVLEALAMKIPVLLRDIPVYSDWLHGGENVYKAIDVDTFRFMAGQILEHKVSDLTEAGYEVAKSRSIEKVGEQLRNVYESSITMRERLVVNGEL